MVGITKNKKNAIIRHDTFSSDSFLNKELVSDIKDIIKEHDLKSKQVKNLFRKEYFYLFEKSKDSIPVCIFDNNELSSLEAITKYLKEDLGMKFTEIGALLERSKKTIWATYQNANKKKSQRFSLKKSDYFLPTSIFKNRAFGVLGSLVKYLREEYNLKYHEIGVLLHRDDRTIWTTYQRVINK